MVRFRDSPQRASAIKRDSECNLRVRVNRMQIHSRDLRGVDVQSDIPDEVLTQGGMFASGPHVNRNIEPLASFDRVRRRNFWRMLRIHGAAQVLELGGELLFLSTPCGLDHSMGDNYGQQKC